MATSPIQIFNGLLTDVAGTAIGAVVPALTAIVLKEIILFNSGAAPNLVQIRLQGTAADTFNIVYETMASKATLVLPFNTVMVAANALTGYATTTAEVHCVVSGVKTV